jgi:thioredoxin reductase
LRAFCEEQGLPYADAGIPVPLASFIAYGEAFQRRLVPNLDQRTVAALDGAADGFAITLDDGEVIGARNVALAIGVSDFAYIPAPLDKIPDAWVTHASRHAALDRFQGREVAVIGSGASATDLAALLHEAGAAVHLVARRQQLRFHSYSPPEHGVYRVLAELRNPTTGIGPGWRHVFYCRAPQLFRHLPEDIRFRIVRNALGPAGGWFMRDRVIGRFPILEGFAPEAAQIKDGRIALRLAGPAGERTLTADHVIAATGYRIDLDAIGFLSDGLRRSIAVAGRVPVLSAHSETSVPGLYIVGPAAAFSFGPVLRFVYGAKPTVPRVARRLARQAPRKSSFGRAALAASR